MSDIKKYVAEMLGSMVLVIVGVGALFGFGLNGLVGVAFAFGLTVAALIYTIGPISGCHINPAVTIGVMAIKGMKMKDGVMYIIFQLIGGLLGVGALWLVVSDWGAVDSDVVKAAFAGVSTFWADSGNHMMSALLVEFLIALVLQLVILGSLANKGAIQNAGIAIGITVTALLFVAGPIDNAGLNPIRDLCAIVAGGTALEQMWLFFVGPILGAIVGSFLFAWFAKPDKA